MYAEMTAEAILPDWGAGFLNNMGRDISLKSSSGRGKTGKTFANVAARMLEVSASSQASVSRGGAVPVTVDVQLPGAKDGSYDQLIQQVLLLSSPKAWQGGWQRDATDQDWAVGRWRRLLLELEFLNSTDAKPDKYFLPTGESTLDFAVGGERITCIFDESYCQILFSKDGAISDCVFQEADLNAASVGKYFREVLAIFQY